MHRPHIDAAPVRPPPMCIRQGLSQAHRGRAGRELRRASPPRRRVLDHERAARAARPAARRARRPARRSRRVARLRHGAGGSGRSGGTRRCLVPRPDLVDAEHAGEELRELHVLKGTPRSLPPRRPGSTPAPAPHTSPTASRSRRNRRRSRRTARRAAPPPGVPSWRASGRSSLLERKRPRSRAARPRHRYLPDLGRACRRARDEEGDAVDHRRCPQPPPRC